MRDMGNACGTGTSSLCGIADVGGVAFGSVSCSATVANVGAHDGVGRDVGILCAEVDEDDIEPTTGTLLEDDCALAFEYFFQSSEFT